MIIFTISNNHYFFGSVHPLNSLDGHSNWLILVVCILSLSSVVILDDYFLVRVQPVLLKGFTFYCIFFDWWHLRYCVNRMDRVYCRLDWLFDPFLGKEDANDKQDSKEE